MKFQRCWNTIGLVAFCFIWKVGHLSCVTSAWLPFSTLSPSTSATPRVVVDVVVRDFGGREFAGYGRCEISAIGRWMNQWRNSGQPAEPSLSFFFCFLSAFFPPVLYIVYMDVDGRLPRYHAGDARLWPGPRYRIFAFQSIVRALRLFVFHFENEIKIAFPRSTKISNLIPIGKGKHWPLLICNYFFASSSSPSSCLVYKHTGGQ